MRPPFGEREPLPGADATIHFERADDLSPEVEGQLLGLIERGFNGGPFWFNYPMEPLDHFRWKYRDCPGGGEIMITERGSEIVHMAGFRNRRARIGGLEANAIDGGESVLEPSLQGTGFAYHVVDYSLSHPGNEHDFAIRMVSHPGQRKRVPLRGGTLPLGNPLRQLTKPLDVGRLSRGHTTPRIVGPSRTAASLQPSWRRALRRSSLVHRADWALRRARNRARYGWARDGAESWQVHGVDDVDPRFDALFDEASRDFDVISVRDSAYLRWRYCDPRSGGFTLRVAEEEGRLLGYSALRVGSGEAAIADLLALPGRLDIVRSLAADAVEVARGAGAPSIRAWLQVRHAYRPVLHRLGFVTGRPSQIPLLQFVLVNIEDDVGALLADPHARIHLTLGDSDHL